ncbi:MAG: hypothetical protein U0U67_09140 [Chitinophagales bacterium]
MINILIIEDDTELANLVAQIIETKRVIYNFIGIIDFATNLAEAKLKLHPNYPTKYKLFFWDILLDEESIILSRYFPKKQSLIIVFTSHIKFIYKILEECRDEDISDQIVTITNEDKEVIKQLDIKEVNKRRITQPSEISTIEDYLLEAEEKYGQKKRIELVNNGFLDVNPLEISFVMVYDKNHLTNDRNIKDLFKERKIIFTKQAFYLTEKDRQAKASLKSYLSLIPEYNYFIQVNDNSIINMNKIKAIHEVKNDKGTRNLIFLEMESNLLSNKISFHTNGNLAAEKLELIEMKNEVEIYNTVKDKPERIKELQKIIAGENYHPHYVLSVNNNFNFIELKPDFNDKPIKNSVLQRIQTYRTNLPFIGYAH